MEKDWNGRLRPWYCRGVAGRTGGIVERGQSNQARPDLSQGGFPFAGGEYQAPLLGLNAIVCGMPPSPNQHDRGIATPRRRWA